MIHGKDGLTDSQFQYQVKKDYVADHFGSNLRHDQHEDPDYHQHQLQAVHAAESVSNWKTKERTIAYVIAKVSQWRRLYNGYYDSNFNH